MEYRFHIDGGFTPATIPMERLGKYVNVLGQLMGETTSVHFARLTTGSLVVHISVDPPAVVAVRERMGRVRDGRPDREAAKAFDDLDGMLRADNASGRLEDDDIVIPFPGRNRPSPMVFGPFRQEGTLEGQVIRVGGRDETIPVHLRDAGTIHTGLHASEDVARRIAQYYLGPAVRVRGVGTWFREVDGTWQLRSFKIDNFEVLDEASLEEVVARLRAVPGSEWSKDPSPVNALLAQREGGLEPH